MAKAVGVKSKHRNYDAYAIKWKRCRDVVSGQDAIYAACQFAKFYLPALVDESQDEYLARLHRAGFYNATWRTIAGFVGMLFRRPATLDVPKEAKALLEDVTMSGISFEAFAKACAYEDLTVSRLGVLVDYPRQQTNADGTALSLAQAETLGLRPIMVQYRAEQIIDWHYSYVSNKYTLTQVRLREEEAVQTSEFETEFEERIKVLDLIDGAYRIRIFDENEEQVGDDVYPLMNGKKLTAIPFFFIGPDSTDATLEDPVLIDLVDLNIKHFQVTADYEHGCHMTGLPTPVVSGYQAGVDRDGNPVEAKFYIGSTTAWVFPDANTKAEFLEFKGTGLTSLEKNLDRKEAQMASIGARMLAPEKTGVEAAATLAMRHSGEHSILAAIAIAVSEGLQKALAVFCEWAGAKGEVKYQINRDFIPIVADAALLTKLIALMQAGKLDDESLFEWLKRADLIDAELSFEDWQTRIDDTELPAPIGHNGGPGFDDEDPKKPKDEKKPKPKPTPAPKAE